MQNDGRTSHNTMKILFFLTSILGSDTLACGLCSVTCACTAPSVRPWSCLTCVVILALSLPLLPLASSSAPFTPRTPSLAVPLLLSVCLPLYLHFHPFQIPPLHFSQFAPTALLLLMFLKETPSVLCITVPAGAGLINYQEH